MLYACNVTACLIKMHALNFDDFLHLLGWESLEEGVTIQMDMETWTPS